MNIQTEVEEEVLAFYGNLMGKAYHTNDCINIVSMREGAQFNNDQKSMLIIPVTIHEIMKALNGTGDMKAHCLDGYGTIFLRLLGVLLSMMLLMQSWICL